MEAQKKEGKTPSVETQKIYDEADKYRSSEDNAQLLDFINKSLKMDEFVNDEDIKRHVVTVITNSVENSELDKAGKTPLYNMLKAIPETELRDVSGGENNNNNSKSKKNKKSNKNKTKKRKGKSSSSRKFKFAKVKKM